MYLLYMDESGQHGGEYFVLAGAAVFERQTYWLAKELDKIQDELLPGMDDRVEFHASQIRAGRSEPWASMGHKECYAVLDHVYTAIAESRVTLFGVAVQRKWLDAAEDEYLFAFESLIGRFDAFLTRLYKQEDERQRSIVIIAESEYRRRLEELGVKVRDEGTRWGELHNLSEIPLFAPAANTRLLQVADFVANAVYGRYERGYSRQFDKLVPRFDAEDGVIHGLAHFTKDHMQCSCPPCLTRRLTGRP